MKEKQYKDRYDDLFIDIEDHANLHDPDIMQKRSGKMLIIIIGVIAIIAAVIFVVRFWRIDDISVEGLETVSEDYVLSLGGLRTGVPIYQYRPIDWEKAIEVDPHLSVDSIRYEFPKRAVINITERKEYAVVQSANQFVYIDREGYVLDISNIQKDPSALIIRGVSLTGYAKNEILGVRDEYQLYVLIQLLEGLYTTGQRGWYVMADITNPVEIAMRTENNIVVRLGSIEDIEKKLTNVSAVLNKLEVEHKASGVIDAIQVSTISYQPSEGSILATPSSNNSMEDFEQENDGVSVEATPISTLAPTKSPQSVTTSAPEENELFDLIPQE